MNIYRLVIPWLIVYYPAYICSNTVLCAYGILLTLTICAWAQVGTGCTKKALCACSAGNVSVLKSEYAGSSKQRMLQRLFCLIAFAVQAAGLGKY